MRSLKTVTSLSLVLMLAACGGGGGKSSAPPPPPPPIPAPSALSYSAPPAYTINVAIVALTPTVTGTVSSYTVSPALPAGLSINATSGAISGTPTAITAATNYTVTATNSTGSTTIAVPIVVNDIPPVVGSATTRFSFSTGRAITDIAPTHTGGSPTGWTVTPALPAGLSIAANSGVISGTPTAASPRATYRVSAQNSGGSGFVDLDLSVSSSVLLELGHRAEIADLKMSGNRLVSVDLDDLVLLQNSQTSAVLSSETVACASCSVEIALAGSTVVAHGDAGFTVRSSTDGSLLANIVVPRSSVAWWRLSSDGSYLSAGSATSLMAWSTTGTSLLNRPGIYADAKAFAAAGELRIGAGPAGAQVIEKIALPSGAVTQSAAFQGTMNAWFDDGERFLTNAATNVWVYSKDAVQQDLAAVPTTAGLAGHGNWFWVASNSTLSIYTVGSSATPAATFSFSGALDRLVPAANVLAILTFGEKQMRVIDLAGGTPTSTPYASAVAYLTTFAANSATDWAVGNWHGVVLGETPVAGAAQIYALGRVLAMSGSSSRLALATASGSIFFFDGSALNQAGEIAFASSRLSISNDGTVLAAAATTADDQYSPDRSLRIYELPSKNLLYQRTRTYSPAPLFIDSSMSRSGTVIGELFSNTGTLQRTLTDLPGSVLYTDTLVAPGLILGDEIRSAVELSPNGAKYSSISGDIDPNTATSIRSSGGALLGAAPGVGIGWIDDDHLILNRYVFQSVGAVGYQGVDIVSTTGAVQASLALPRMTQFQALSATRIFSPEQIKVYDLTNGSVQWSSGSAHSGVGAVSGDNVVFESGTQVRVEPL